MTEFKKGDAVEPKASSGLVRGVKREVAHVGDKWVLYKHNGEENCMWREEFERDFVVVMPFFEVGKTYHRHVEWSISTQRKNVTETFKPLSVQTSSSGKQIAFGKYSTVEKPEQYDWFMMSRWNWDHESWKVQA